MEFLEQFVSYKFFRQTSATITPHMAQANTSWNGLTSWHAGLALSLHHSTSNDSVAAQPFR